MATKKKSHYVVADSGGEYTLLHINAYSRVEAAREFVADSDITTNDLNYDHLEIGVCLESDVTYFRVEPAEAFDFREIKKD